MINQVTQTSLTIISSIVMPLHIK